MQYRRTKYIIQSTYSSGIVDNITLYSNSGFELNSSEINNEGQLVFELLYVDSISAEWASCYFLYNSNDELESFNMSTSSSIFYNKYMSICESESTVKHDENKLESYVEAIYESNNIVIVFIPSVKGSVYSVLSSRDFK